MAKVTKKSTTELKVDPAPATPADDIAYLELPEFKLPISSLPPEMQDLVDVYRQWAGEQQKAQQAALEAERGLVLARRSAFLYEAGLKSLSEELIARATMLKNDMAAASAKAEPESNPE